MCIELRFQLYIKDIQTDQSMSYHDTRGDLFSVLHHVAIGQSQVQLCSGDCGRVMDMNLQVFHSTARWDNNDRDDLPLYSKMSDNNDSRGRIMIEKKAKALVYTLCSLFSVETLFVVVFLTNCQNRMWLSWPIARIECDIRRYKVGLIWCLTWLCTPSRLFPVTSSYTSPTTLYTIAVGINVTQFIKQRTCPQPWQCMNIHLQSACREHSQSEHVTWEQMKDDNVWSNDVKKGGDFLNKSGTLKWRNTEQKIRVVEINFQIK